MMLSTAGIAKIIILAGRKNNIVTSADSHTGEYVEITLVMQKPGRIVALSMPISQESKTERSESVKKR